MSNDIRKFINIVETGSILPKILTDDIGGFIKIDPNPDIIKNSKRISISYINHTIAKFYDINPRIIAYDSHGHRGFDIFDPHFHIFTKRHGSGYYGISNSISHKLINVIYIKIFYIIKEKIVNRYIKDIRK